MNNFWELHGYLFLICLVFFPRIALLFTPFGGFLWWLGWVFVPRLLIAVIATMHFYPTNIVLVVFSWLIAINHLLEKRDSSS
jgi:hypothetical protein